MMAKFSIPFLVLLLTSGCASVYLGSGGTKGSTALRDDPTCGRRLWQAIGSPPSIRVECHNGIVTLRGTIATRESRNALLEYVHQQPGVEKVNDHLVVR